ncbi:exo-alpha-sialidase [Aliifodinibius sp. S!AR15-10]|uniref:sialidase family protein n=1 Tax=Aliifodinibius sp. S!AR15-10 TaxID=2950437 RepID=UPI00285658AC|nr:sialidase family protein [Aliifodinibius sp. S!AR15-10]MDR8390771.1 exo-alpha-sialidase [Aliifodinibius sp. S!AR15-10]
MRYLILLLVFSTCLNLSCSSTQHNTSNNRPVVSNQVSTHQAITPILIGKEANPVLRVEVDGNSDKVVNSITISTEGTTQLTDIDEIHLFYTGSDSVFNVETKLHQTTKATQKVSLPADQKLQQGANYFWISYKVDPKADLLNRVDASLEAVTMNDGSSLAPANRPLDKGLKLGIALRQQGEEGVHTYRIPGMVTTNSGTLIAAYDIRYDNPSDLQGDIDVGISRSTDKGESWEPMQIIMDMEEWGGRPEDENGIGDPSILVDKNTGTIWVAALWTHGMPGQRAWNASGTGVTPEETGQFVLVKSEDDGKTWSEPINITKQIKKPEWQLLLQGPGRGITMSGGTLVFPAQFKDANGMPYSTIVYSKDHGKTWDIGTGAKANTTEAQVVELSDGSLMLNMRDNRGGSRSIYTTEDLGQTWTKHPTSRSALKEPVCMASLIHFPYREGETGKHCLLFSNPNSREARENMTIKMSTDDGMSWPKENQILLNENSGYGYSCMTPIDEQTVGILYEGVRELYFQKVKISELLDGQSR